MVLVLIPFIRHSLRKLSQSLEDLIYPPLCLHCNTAICGETALFCPSCQLLLEMISPEERCPHCFSPDYVVSRHHCPHCIKRPPVLYRMAAVFDYVGPAATLVKKMKYSDQPYLAKGGGAFLAAQFLQLGWPIPDAVIPVPMAIMHWIDRGYNQSELLAQQFAEIMGCPMKNVLKRHSGDYSQAGLSLHQRKELSGERFCLKENQPFHDKTLLLIDDVMTSGSTLRKCAEVLFASYPQSIYGLTLCRAIK